MLNSLRFEEEILKNIHTEFPARYMAACNLRRLMAGNPGQADVDTIRGLEKLMFDQKIVSHRQSFFFFRETAGAIADSITGGYDALIIQAIHSFKNLLNNATGSSLRAATEALGSLPIPLSPPSIDPNSAAPLPTIRWPELAKGLNISPDHKPSFAGRSLIQPIGGNDQVLVAKFCRNGENSDNLRIEAAWMHYFREQKTSLPTNFLIPRPLVREDAFLFRLTQLPVSPPDSQDIQNPYTAILYTVHRDYFSYANEPKNFANFRQAKDNMALNSLILGQLAARGIIHTAPIPLFHNRVQRHRREDNGLYDWPRGGRLDQWLPSCVFPNLGLTGIRDFEHFTTLQQSGERFYWHIGCHILSLLLVAASFFRNRDKELTGLDFSGKPVDARHLFDPNHFSELLRTILHGYYEGFTGELFEGELPVNLDLLSSRMIEEMGVDHSMEEVLRQVDQRQMNEEEFRDFLVARGFSPEKAVLTTKDVADIILLTGPHLGGFNQQISIPELIEATATMAATCVLGLYLRNSASNISPGKATHPSTMETFRVMSTFEKKLGVCQ
ncbi:MAG: SidJ-related pseudokinase [Pseudomonadota bacterium]